MKQSTSALIAVLRRWADEHREGTYVAQPSHAGILLAVAHDEERLDAADAERAARDETPTHRGPGRPRPTTKARRRDRPSSPNEA